MAILSVNPTTEEVLASFEELSPGHIEAALSDASAAFALWRRTPFAERSTRMRHAATYLRENQARFARLITQEMGKPITQAEAEIEKCAWNCDFYAESAEQFLADEEVQTSAVKSYVAFEPLGPVLAVMPWNFPFWQVFRFAAPAVMAGNSAVLKHASNVPQSALAIQEVFAEAGFPPVVFQALLISAEQVEPVIADPRVRAVTLTGSDVTGSKIAEAAGRHLKKTVLELGGSDPFMVLEDADLDAAAQTGARARAQNAGQSCIAAKRFIVVEAVADQFEQRFSQALRSLRIGDPVERETDVGPLARADLRDGLEEQVQASAAAGARVALGGARRNGRGYFFDITLVADVTPEMAVWREETFGPVAAVRRVKDAEEAVAAANDSQYGLGASLWTTDLERAERLARDIEAGVVFVNGMVASDPRLPFGGVKRSGYGRELGVFGIREFTNIQTIWVQGAGTQQPQTPPGAPSE